MTRFIDFSNQKEEKCVVKEEGAHVFFLYNRSGKLEIEIRKARAKIYVFGVFVGKKQDSFKVQTIQSHLSPASFSELSVKGVFFDESKIDYNGLIRIEKRARGSHAYQKNQNLLMSKSASVESKPVLEILTDDVFCTHGSTTGQPDAEQIFYLQTRGLVEKAGRNLLAKGFLNEVFEKMFDLGVNQNQFKKYKSLIATL